MKKNKKKAKRITNHENGKQYSVKTNLFIGELGNKTHLASSYQWYYILPDELRKPAYVDYFSTP